MSGAAAAQSIEFSPTLDAFSDSRRNEAFTVLCGVNNSGKSLILKELKSSRGKSAYLVGPVRFYHIYHLSTQYQTDQDYDNVEAQFLNDRRSSPYNSEQNYIDLGRIIASLNDSKRNMLLELCGELIGNRFSLRKLDPDNELSMRYIDMDGQNVSVGSTGTRLLMTMLGLCMNEKFDCLMIDEPELGLGPRVQSRFGRFLSNPERRSQYFPHLRQIFIATHSHLFLDKKNISNNFVVEKTENQISIEQISNFAELHRLQFNLLGNDPEDLYLPSAFVIVEGKTDEIYLRTVLQKKFPAQNILVLPSGGDVKRIVNSLRSMLGDFTRSPFKYRTFVVLDAVHNRSDKSAVETMGVPSEHLFVWERNGIEFVYPSRILAEIFACAESNLSDMRIEGDDVVVGSVSFRKAALCDQVVSKLRDDTVYPVELDGFLAKIAEAL